jgi:hypothetical protein
MSLGLHKVEYKLCSNVHQPHGLIFNCKIHNVIHILDVKLKVQTMTCKERCLLCGKIDCVIIRKLYYGKKLDQLSW